MRSRKLASETIRATRQNVPVHLRIFISLIIALFFIGLSALRPELKNAREEAVRKRLSFLMENPHIAWVEFEVNRVYIGWYRIPADFEVVNHDAAVLGNQAADMGLHLYSVKAEQRGWRDGKGPGPCLCETLALFGKIYSSDCRVSRR